MQRTPEPILAVDAPLNKCADGAIEVFAPAKINLDLYVGPLDETGYHPLDSIVTKIAFYDRLVLVPAKPGSFTLRVDGLNCGPATENLALRAARRLAEEANVTAGVDIGLSKTIPPGMGLGGGSSDAAAVLIGLNELWELNWPTEQLAEIALTLGSDVQLFLAGPASRMTGRGEYLEAVILAPFTVVLVLPDLHCSTGAVYRAYDEAPAPPLAGRAVGATRPGRGMPSTWRESIRNDLAAPARCVEPALAAIWDEIADGVDLPVHLTGSGSGLFVVCESLDEARAVWRQLPTGAQAISLITGPNPW
jgi:4-diphosphocytidyl-2-C-methyl-D-erythritol kinase